MKALNSGVNTLKHSYGSIIQSLMMMNNRRVKKRFLEQQKQIELEQQQQQQQKGKGKNFLDNEDRNSRDCSPFCNDIDISKQNDRNIDLERSSSRSNQDEKLERFSIEAFLDPNTRDETFQLLFNEVCH